ncbi:MAG: hypothetical protein Q9M32_06480 [Sulfurimonas sp.]|nr:hypothetical protein [Sulfurimonas sp.]MDQ7062370.1 hypothetical protein [Sulfurimonas sp.]
MKYILILLLLIPFLQAKEFSIIIEKPFNEALFDITQDYDRTISAVGFTKEYKQSANHSTTYTNAFDYLSSLSNSNGSQVAFVKVDKHANILINKQSKMSKFSRAVALVKTPSNGYFIGGYTLDGSLLITKLDANANVLFSKTFGTKNYDRMNNLILLSDGGVLAIGSASTSRSPSDSLFETGLGLNDIYLTRFSKNGHKIWSKKYGTSHDDNGIDAVEARDGSIIVVSTTSYHKNKNITLMRITENGNKVWLKQFKEEDKVTPYKIIRLRDNNFLLSLSKRNELGKEQIRLIKFNLQRNIMIDKEIVTSYSSALKDIKEYSDGSIIGVGYVKDTYNTDALVMILDNTMSMLHQEHFGDENYDMFNALTILHNSQAAVAGLNTHPDSQESNMWIAKINRDGTMAQVSTKIENFYLMLKKIFADEIRMGTLLIKEDLTIELLDAKLLFSSGEYKLNKIQIAFINKFSKKLIPFLYAHKEAIKALEINGHTSSEWSNSDFPTNYLNNEKLSMGRSFSTLTHLFSSQDMQTQKWLSKILKGSGLGFSKKIVFDNVEYKQRSRRVSFKLIL